MSPIISGGLSGSGSVSSFTDVVTTDPNTFLATWEHDFEQVIAVYVQKVVTALNGDGETWGSGPGDIALGIGGVPGGWEGRRDGLPAVGGWTTQVQTWYVLAANVNDSADTVGQYGAQTLVVPQCLRFTPGFIGIYQAGGAGTIYAGPNHPTATFSLTVEYLTT